MPTKKTEANGAAETPPEGIAQTLDEKERLRENMRFFGQVCNTPTEAQKDFNNGRFSGTDINPMWRIKMLTQIFGPAGFGWWTQNVRYRFEDADITGKDKEGKRLDYTEEKAVFCELELVVVDPATKAVSQPIYGVGGNMFLAQRTKGAQSSDEAMKMAYTDALSIACKALGFSADIYYSKDKTKYTADTPTEPTAEDFATMTGRIKKGIDLVTKDMDADQKNAFIQDVIVAIVGNANYIACKDMAKLSALLTKVQEIYKNQKTDTASKG